METSSSEPVVILQTARRGECMECRLVLSAVGIPSAIHHHRGVWVLAVSPSLQDRAIAEWDDYRAENATKKSVTLPAFRSDDSAINGCIAYAVVIVSVAALNSAWVAGGALFEPGEMQAGTVIGETVFDGQWYRVITALTLHLDAGHLASNLLFGTVFGFFAGQVLGGGIAWLAILLAGGLGNGVNAWVQSPDHTSVGASTAVFGALGVIVAHALRPRQSPDESLFRRWSPLVAGIMIFSLTGVGDERTDVMAHITGFMAGLLVGWFARKLPGRLTANRRIQVAAGGMALLIVCVTWGIALA